MTWENSFNKLALFFSPGFSQIFGANDVVCTRIYVREWCRHRRSVIKHHGKLQHPKDSKFSSYIKQQSFRLLWCGIWATCSVISSFFNWLAVRIHLCPNCGSVLDIHPVLNIQFCPVSYIFFSCAFLWYCIHKKTGLKLKTRIWSVRILF